MPALFNLRHVTVVAICLVGLIAFACGEGDPTIPPTPEPSERARDAARHAQEALDAWRVRALELYEEARRQGSDLPDFQEWATRDLEQLGRWEYHVSSVEAGDPERIAAQLNELGALRWECFQAMPTASGLMIYCRRPADSVLGSIPVWQIIRLLSLGSLIPGNE